MIEEMCEVNIVMIQEEDEDTKTTLLMWVRSADMQRTPTHIGL